MTPEEIQAEIDAITESGGPKPQFAGNEILTATNLNLATRHWVTTEVPGDHLGENGDIAFVAGGAAPNSQLPLLGGWAELEEVSGTFTKHPYGDWVAYEWTGDGSVKVSEGLVDTLMVAGGMYYGSSIAASTSGGRVSAGILDLSADTYDCTVDVKFAHTQRGNAGSSLRRSDGVDVAIAHRGLSYVAGNNEPFGAFADIGIGELFNGFKSSITGVEKEYGQGYKINGSATSDAPGNAGQAVGDAHDGAIIIRVPAANAQNVIENFYRWISYATVENGVVTKVTKTPDNKPYTASAQEVECDASVQEGYLYENGEFTAPEPDYSDEIEALTARLEELRNV